jgi:divalent metal cation (Fe/Co/Zn/Cd) transporter
MRPLVTIYWARIALGIVAAAIGAGLEWIRGIQSEFQISNLMNGLTIALLIYLVSYYVFKATFRAQVEKQSKIMTMGIGVYFFTWIVFWILLFSILRGPPIPFA